MKCLAALVAIAACRAPSSPPSADDRHGFIYAPQLSQITVDFPLTGAGTGASHARFSPGTTNGQDLAWNGFAYSLDDFCGDPHLRECSREEFENFNTNCTTIGGSFIGSATGAGATCTGATLDGHTGVWSGATGTTATGGVRFANNVAGHTFGGNYGPSCAEEVVYLPALSNSTIEYFVRIGFLDAVTLSNSTDAVQAVYDRPTKGNFWALETRSNSVSTVTACDGAGGTTAAPVTAALFAVLKECVSADGSTADLYVNDVKCATNTTNIPIGTGRAVGWGAQIGNNSGSVPASESLYLDWFRVSMPIIGGSIGARPTYAETHITQFPDTTGAGRPNAQIMQKCGPNTNEWCYPRTVDTNPSAKHALIVVLSGRGDSPIHVFTNTFPQIRFMKDDLDAIMMGVEAKTSSSGTNSWNASQECCWPPGDGAGVDDDTYIDSKITEAINDGWPIDPKRIYVIGHSAGSAMSFRYACDHPSRVAAVLGMSTFAIRTDIDPACAAGNVSFVHFHGTIDSVAYDNSTNATLAPNTVEFVSVETDRTSPTRTSTTKQEANQNGCGGTLQTITTGWLDFDSDVVGSETDLKRWSGCPAGVDVEVWKANGTSHNPTMTAAGEAAIVNFFKAHAKP